MVREIVHDPMFLQRKSEDATGRFADGTGFA